MCWCLSACLPACLSVCTCVSCSSKASADLLCGIPCIKKAWRHERTNHLFGFGHNRLLLPLQSVLGRNERQVTPLLHCALACTWRWFVGRRLRNEMSLVVCLVIVALRCAVSWEEWGNGWSWDLVRIYPLTCPEEFRKSRQIASNITGLLRIEPLTSPKYERGS